MTEYENHFTEEQRHSVCEGELCPHCLGNNIETKGGVPDGINLNMAYQCKDCKAEWEGY